jgi:hypothetical protein
VLVWCGLEGKGVEGLRSEGGGGGRLTADAAADAIFAGVVDAVGLRARDLQDWFVQVVHFVLS